MPKTGATAFYEKLEKFKTERTESQKEHMSDFASRPIGGDRTSVRLRSADVDLIRSVCAVNPRTIVSVITAGAVIIEEWQALVPGILISWYNGCENGKALADIISGRSNPSGRLPWSMPKSEAHLPHFDRDADKITYDKWVGQRLLDKLGVAATFPLGFGLSYTQYTLENATASQKIASDSYSGHVDITLSNVGDMAGWCVVQVYGCPQWTTPEPDFPKRVLLGFKAVEVQAGQSTRESVDISFKPVRRWVENAYVLDVESVKLEIGQHAGDEASVECKWNFNKALL